MIESLTAGDLLFFACRTYSLTLSDPYKRKALTSQSFSFSSNNTNHVSDFDVKEHILFKVGASVAPGLESNSSTVDARAPRIRPSLSRLYTLLVTFHLDLDGRRRNRQFSLHQTPDIAMQILQTWSSHIL